MTMSSIIKGSKHFMMQILFPKIMHSCLIIPSTWLRVDYFLYKRALHFFYPCKIPSNILHLAAIVCIREQQNGKKGWILFYMRTSQNVWYICSVLFVYDFYFSQTLWTTFLKEMTLPTDDNVFKNCCFCVFEKVLLPKFWLNTTRNVSKLCDLDGSGCFNLLICSCWLKPIHEKGKREKNDKENYLFFIPFMHIFYIVGMVYCMYGILYLFIYFEQKLIIL